MRRRTFVAGSGVAIVAAVAGCGANAEEPRAPDRYTHELGDQFTVEDGDSVTITVTFEEVAVHETIGTGLDQVEATDVYIVIEGTFKNNGEETVFLSGNGMLLRDRETGQEYRMDRPARLQVSADPEIEVGAMAADVSTLDRGATERAVAVYDAPPSIDGELDLAAWEALDAIDNHRVVLGPLENHRGGRSGVT